MRNPRIIAARAVLVATASVGGYFLVKWLNRSVGGNVSHNPGPARQRQAAEVPAIRFTDVTGPSGIRFRHTNGATEKKLLPETMGGGVAILDYDGDGKPDILFVNSCPWPGHTADSPPPTLKLYRNKGDLTFEDVTEAVGLNVT